VEIYELVVTDKWHGARVGELLPQAECRAVALTRAGRAMLPVEDTQVEVDDVLHISATLEGIESLHVRLNAPGER
jgi:hypothetical protein